MGDPLPVIDPGPAPVIEDVNVWCEPVDLLERLGGHRHPVLLLSGQPDHPASRYSILACDPLLSFTVSDGAGTWIVDAGEGPRKGRGPIGDPFESLRSVVPVRPAGNAAGWPFLGGAIGYLGYGLRRRIERFHERPPDPLRHPDAWFGVYEAAVLFDHREKRLVIGGTACPGPAGDPQARLRGRMSLLRDRVREVAAAGGRGCAGDAPAGRRRALPMTPRREHLARVERALEHIAAGEIYQVNLSHRIACRFDGSPVSLFRRLSGGNPAPFAAFLDTGPLQVVSASPERFLGLRSGLARSVPIKGTRPRGSGPDEDARLAASLVASPKDRAENVMITDLVRNDLGRVCAPGSVAVERLCGLETFATVHHLVSSVVGRLRPDRDRVDLIRALFPGGSMTGAPKVRAMQVIDRLEGEERGIYAGAIGHLSFHGSVDLNIVIRTIVCQNGWAQMRVGGGIVAESDPQEEYRESLDKARALLDALEAEI